MTATNSLLAASAATNPDVFNNGTFAQTIGAGMPGRGVSTDTTYQATVGASATYQFFGTRVGPTNTYSGGNTAVTTFRKNGANGNQLCTLTGAGAAFVEDITHTDSVAAGDLLNSAFTGNSNSPDCNLSLVQVAANKATPSVPYVSNFIAGDAIPLNNVFYYGLYGVIGTNTSEALSQSNIRGPGSLGYLSFYLGGISGATVTAVSRKNGATGNQSAATTTTGWTSDVTHTDAVAGGDTAGTRVTSASGTCTLYQVNCTFAGSSSKHDAGATQSISPFTASTTCYLPFAGQIYPTQTSETPRGQKSPYGLTASNFRFSVAANSAASATATFRKNAGAGNQSVSFSSGQTGLFEDSTHSDTIATGDVFNAQWVTGAGSTSGFTPTQIVVSLDDGSNTGSSTETGVGVMSFSGIGFSASARASPAAVVGVMAFSGAAFAGRIASDDVAGRLAFAGVSFVGAAADSRVTAGALNFAGIAIAASSADIHVTTTATLAFAGIAISGRTGHLETLSGALTFAGIAIQASVFDYPPAGRGLRSFATFGV